MDPRMPSGESFPPATADFHSMPYRRMGHSGLKTSAMGLGTWKFGFPETGDGSRSDEETSLEILDLAYELGVTFWDTANRYNNGTGNSERIIGTWLTLHPKRRRDIVLATKVAGGMDGYTPNHHGLSRLQIIEGVKASLARLNQEWIDLLWFHSFDPETPIEESLETIEDLVSQGLIHYFGVSQFTVDNLEAYLTAADKISRRCRPVAVQNQYNPLHGADRPGVLELCASEGLAFVPYSPLAQGLLSDRYLDPARTGSGDRLVDEGREVSASDRAALQRLAELSRDWGHSISQLSLAYLLTLPGMGSQIPSSSSTAQLEANAAAGRITLTEHQAASLRQTFAACRDGLAP